MYRTLKEQAERAAQADAAAAAPSAPRAREPRTPGAPSPARRAGKLSFNEQRELEGMEAAILAAEERKAALEAALSDPGTYQRDGAAVAGVRADLEAATAEVERLYQRWQELESRRPGK